MDESGLEPDTMEVTADATFSTATRPTTWYGVGIDGHVSSPNPIHGNAMRRIDIPARRRTGFTLAEVLVTLALLALLGAALLPVVSGQILKGDAGRVTEDLRSVQIGIEQFLGDIHRYPGKYSDLSKVITTANTDINAAAYTTGLVAKWAGPYVAKDTVNASVPSGYGGSITNVFMKVANTNGVNYVTVVITGINGTDFDRIDLQFDGVVNRTAGLLRWVSAGGIDSTKYLATPIQ